MISEKWDSYGKMRDGVFMIISFDDEAANGDQPADLELCARIIIPINEMQTGSALPVESEEEFLYLIEDEIVDLLSRENINCRLVARLTYDGLREVVFQVKEEDSFRAEVGKWIRKHVTHDIDVSEHEGWGFFNDFVSPTPEDRWMMTENRVIDNLLENGSDPNLEHDLEYCFEGNEESLRKIAEQLQKKNYSAVGESDFASGCITMSIAMKIDRHAIIEESKQNRMIAIQSGGELNGWGAAVRR
ncbi:MAG: DUF695 domain-containing protein [Verrucomicrobiales bacterium]|nr:DUF695 domain-containing protein [Verrucomicrobiales bacterium]